MTSLSGVLGLRLPGRRHLLLRVFPLAVSVAAAAEPAQQVIGKFQDQFGWFLAAQPAPACVGESHHRLEAIDLLGFHEPGPGQGVDDVRNFFPGESAVPEDSESRQLVELPFGHPLGLGPGEHLGDDDLAEAPLGPRDAGKDLQDGSPGRRGVDRDGRRGGQRRIHVPACSCRIPRSGPTWRLARRSS